MRVAATVVLAVVIALILTWVLALVLPVVHPSGLGYPQAITTALFTWHYLTR